MLREEIARRLEKQVQTERVLFNLVRIIFLTLVLLVLWNVWSVTTAHLTEQFLAVEQQSDALIDPDEGEDALTPENIEAYILALTLRLREDQLS
ncbi:MAG: hypothetical protein OXC27_03050, partial [Caldilineaceae bacterium]|nr:hypothetical protein [Caldilineaceae bacterium]